MVLHGAGVAAISTLPALLPEWQLLRPGQAGRHGADGVLAWGRKPSAERAQVWAARRQLPLCWLEDGFIRSVELGHRSPPLAVVVDDVGMYYDARSPSRLEDWVLRPRRADELARGEALRAQWQAQRVSKYNHSRDQPGLAQPGDVLVVDQTWGDASIACGLAGPGAFARMLEAALDEHPGARILLKVHPDVIAGRKRGHFAQLSAAQRQRVQLLGHNVHPPSLLATVAAVYVVTSQMGFEALMWGRPVRCFGMPFYAGWGLTGDDLPAPSRRRPASLAALTHAALVDYSRCLDPETRQPCPPERLIDWLGLQQRERQRFPAQLRAVGFSWWKRPLVRRFLAGSALEFVSARHTPAPGTTLVLWGRRPPPQGAQAAPVIRLEDGFLRSVGLGADLTRPLSWVADPLGLYYDTRQPSQLHQILLHHPFDVALRQRAALLRQRIVASGLTKYNVGHGLWQRPAAAGQRPVVLVVGQVESDAAVRYGSPVIQTNLGLLQAARAARPDAWLLYKPHPDVVARLRAAGQHEDQALSHCDELVLDVSMDTLLRQVDAVQVLTSLAGFESLLRGLPVTVWGCPFYAGWGLTDDRHPQPLPRRRLTLDELVAAVLILYPRYVSQDTGCFTTPERALDELQQWRATLTPAAPTLWRRLLRALLRTADAYRRSRPNNR